MPSSAPVIARHASVRGQRRPTQWYDLRITGPIGVTLLAALLRFTNLGWPNVLVFDETYYVKDAWSLGARGNEAKWPETPNPAFESGDVNSFLSGTGSFVVHPPLGKWLIWLGMRADPTQPWSWRLSTAIAGTLTVLLLAIIATYVCRSAVLGTLAGGFLAIDGLAIVMSRTGLLDVFIGLFVTAAFGTLLLDRRWYRRRLVATRAALVWWRPWLLATAVLLGCATSVKWSGLYFAAAFGLYTVIDGLLVRRRIAQRDLPRSEPRLRRWPLYSLAQSAINALIMLPTVIAVYLLSWTGWLVTADGWGRQWGAEHPATGWQAWLPDALRSLIEYHRLAYNFHTSLAVPHAWASNPLTWPLMLRPTLFWREITEPGVDGCTSATSCIGTVSSVANPLLWWGGHLALLLLLYVLIRHRDWRAGAVLMAFAAGYLPWLLYLGRTVFFFYAVAWQPFVILALVYAFRQLLPDDRDLSVHAVIARRRSSLGIAAFTVLAVAVSAFFYPLWVGQSVPYGFWVLHSWIPGLWT